MIDELQQHMRKARRVLKSVERRAAEDDPDAVVSTAYYAMFHAACAVVLQRHGRLPKTHASLIGQFGLIVRDLDLEDRSSGTALNEAFDRRSIADYSVVIQLTRNQAMEARDQARAFIDYCRTLRARING